MAYQLKELPFLRKLFSDMQAISRFFALCIQIGRNKENALLKQA